MSMKGFKYVIIIILAKTLQRGQALAGVKDKLDKCDELEIFFLCGSDVLIANKKIYEKIALKPSGP